MVLTIVYGMPIFIFMSKVEPRVSGVEEDWSPPSLRPCTVPEPSSSWCRAGSATTAKIAAAGALMNRSTVSTFLSGEGEAMSGTLPGVDRSGIRHLARRGADGDRVAAGGHH